jgi:hypothetical protein
MKKTLLLLSVILICATTIFAQSPYGKILTLKNDGTQEWIDIGTVLSNYMTYHPVSPTPTWLTNGNFLLGSEKFGSKNDQPVVVITNNADRFRFTTKGQIEVLNSAGSVFLGEGAGANQDNSSNRNNVFVGYQAGNSNTTGRDNTASGTYALYSNTTGIYNTASGVNALYSNTIGFLNTASGSLSLYSNTTGYNNTASGTYALYSNTTGHDNTASGTNALYYNTTGNSNTASGNLSLRSNTTGLNNTASGFQSLLSNTTGNNNTAMGYQAGSDLTTGSNNILIGYNAQPSSATVSNEVTIGNSNNNSYRMYAASWTNASDARYKHDITDLPYGLDFILKLRPRQYVYNNSIDNKITMGFIAQEVQEVMKNYNIEDKFNLVKIIEKDYLGLNTTEIIPVLVKAVQEQQQTIKQQEQYIKQQEQYIIELNARLEKLEKQFEKISK